MLKSEVDKGVCKFIIYPFGSNGKRVKDILKDYFQIVPELIIDNEFCNYHNEIYSFDYLKAHYSDGSKLILTIEDEELNKKMYSECLKFVGRDNLINCLDLVETKKSLSKVIVTDQFALKKFLPNLKDKSSYLKTNHKSAVIKVRFFLHSYVFWNSMKTICEAFRKDARYEVLVILRDNEPELMKNLMEKENYRYIMKDEYNARMDCPDIMILTHANPREVIANCRKYTKLIVVASLMLIRYTHNIDNFWHIIKTDFEDIYSPDVYLFDKLIFDEVRGSKYYSKKIYEMGNAKFDGIYKTINGERNYPTGWEKLQGKRTILWTTDHGIDTHIEEYVTFDLYAKAIFEYANQNPDVGIIMRLHQTFKKELMQYGYWDEADIEELRRYCHNSPNIVWDETESYDVAYTLADGILTDALCGITVSALPTLKPICVMYRNHDVKSFHPEITNNYYSAYNEGELISFIDMVVEGRDPKKELRVELVNKYIPHFDGKNGERIKEFIASKFDEINV